VLVGMLSVFLIKKLNIKTIYGEKIILHTKTFNQGQIYGGLLFGLCDYRSLPRPAVCTNRHRFFCNCGYIIKRNSWYLGLWIGKRKIAALKMVLKNMESLKNYA
jgi:hypothetical protein